MKSIQHQWDEIERSLIPSQAPTIQRREMRLAFFAGFSAALISLIDVADESGDNDDIGATKIEQYHKECRDFFKVNGR